MFRRFGISPLLVLISYLAAWSGFAQCSKELLRWDQDAVLYNVAGYLVPGGIDLHLHPDFKTVPGVPAGSVFVTSHFFQQSGIPVPEGAAPYVLRTYRYTREDRGSSQRGSGRDQIYWQDSRQVRSRKGSGTNRYFSQVNGPFKASDFRANGLVAANEGVLEYILLLIFDREGFPAVKHPKLTLFPKSLQRPSITKGDARRFAVQIDRDDRNGRDSLSLTGPTLDQRLDFISSFYFFNAAHGAVNPENVTSHAEILDTGHLGFGYPMLSGARRCTLCADIEGALNHSGSMGGVDYYFPKNGVQTHHQGAPHGHLEAEYDFQLSSAEMRRFVAKLTKRAVNRSIAVRLSAVEEKALHQALSDELLWKGRPLDGFAEVRRLSEALTGRKYGDYGPDDREIGYSLRALMQVAALKSFLKPKEYRRLALKAVLLGRTFQVQQSVQALIGLFERCFEDGQADSQSISKLFEEYAPSNELKERIDQALEGRSFEEIPRTVEKLVNELSRPLRLNPHLYAKHFESLLDRLNPSIDEGLLEEAVEAFQSISALHSSYLFSEALGKTMEGFALPVDFPGLLHQARGTRLGRKWMRSMYRLFDSGGLSESAKARLVAKSFAHPSPAVRDFILERFLRVRMEFDSYGARTPLQAADLWMRDESKAPNRKADFLLSFVGVSARLFERFLGGIPESQREGVWARFDERGWFRMYYELARKKGEGALEFLLDRAAIESFLFAREPFEEDLKRYAVAMTPVTQLQYALVTGEAPSHFKTDAVDFLGLKIDPNAPVESVSLLDTGAFLKKINALKKRVRGRYDLPTSGEYEHALKRTDEPLGLYAWYDGNSEGRTHPVARLRENPFGLFDMNGNVMSWVLSERDAQNLRGNSIHGEASESAPDHSGSLFGEYDSRYVGFRVVLRIRE